MSVPGWLLESYFVTLWVLTTLWVAITLWERRAQERELSWPKRYGFWAAALALAPLVFLYAMALTWKHGGLKAVWGGKHAPPVPGRSATRGD